MSDYQLLLVYDIEVAPSISNATGYYLNGTSSTRNGSTAAHSLPLENVVGVFSTDAFQAVAFALHVLAFLASSLLAIYSFRRTARAKHQLFFRLRVGLLFYVLSRLLESVYALVPNCTALPRDYIVFYTIPTLFEAVSDVTLLWTLLRTACQPMVVANGFTRAKSVAVGFTAIYGIFLAISWFLLCTNTYAILQEQIVMLIDVTHARPLSGRQVFGFVINALEIGLGFLALAFSICSRLKTRASAAIYREVALYALFASIIWIIRSSLVVLSGVESSQGVELVISPGVITLTGAITRDVFGVAFVGILFLCHRSKFAPLFSSDNSYLQLSDEEGYKVGLRSREDDDSIGMELRDSSTHTEGPYESENGLTNRG